MVLVDSSGTSNLITWLISSYDNDVNVTACRKSFIYGKALLTECAKDWYLMPGLDHRTPLFGISVYVSILLTTFHNRVYTD